MEVRREFPWLSAENEESLSRLILLLWTCDDAGKRLWSHNDVGNRILKQICVASGAGHL